MSAVASPRFVPCTTDRLDEARAGAIERLTRRRIEFAALDPDDAREQAREAVARMSRDSDSSIARWYDLVVGDEVIGSCLLHREGVAADAHAMLGDLDAQRFFDGGGSPTELRRALELAARDLGAVGLDVSFSDADEPSALVAVDGGYRRIATRMLRRLEGTAPAVSSVTVSLEPMTSEEYEKFEEHLIVSYAADMARAGAVSEQEAEARSRAQTAELLPEGPRTEDHHLFTVRDSAESLGILWLFESGGPSGPRGYVYDIEIAETARGRGIGRATMIAAELFLRERGHRFIALNVFGFNDVARGLYESLGYVASEEFAGTAPGGELFSP